MMSTTVHETCIEEYNKLIIKQGFVHWFGQLLRLLTYSMVQSHSWAANWFAASQEIPRISRNPKVHYRTHKRPPSVSILGQSNPVHIPTSHLLEIHPNITHPSTPRSPQWFNSLFIRRNDHGSTALGSSFISVPQDLITLYGINCITSQSLYLKASSISCSTPLLQHQDGWSPRDVLSIRALSLISDSNVL